MQKTAHHLGIRAERLPFGVALHHWPPRAPCKRDTTQPARLIHVASLNRVKDQATLVEAVRELRALGYRFHLDIAGEDVLNGRIQQMCLDCGLSDAVTFHGWLPHSGLRPLMEQAHLLLITSRHEADPIVLLEAAVAGVPAVGTAVGHLRDWAPSAAVSVPVGDAAALARETAGLLTDESRRLKLAAAAHRRALDEDSRWTATRVLELYAQLAGNGDLRKYRCLSG